MKFFKGCADGVHDFEARYDKDPAMMEFEGGLSEMRLRLVEKCRKITYVRDVCVRCGKTVERNSEVVPMSRSA